MSRGKFGGITGYVKMMALLRERSTTIPAFRAKHGLSYLGAYSFFTGLHHLERAHICRWLIRPRVAPIPVFALGMGVDMPCPSRTRNGRASRGGSVPTGAPRSTLVVLAYILRELERAPADMPRLMEVTGLARSTARQCVQALIAEGFIHLGSWRRDTGGNPRPVYHLGGGVPAERPARTPRKVANARYWAKYSARRAANATPYEVAA